MWWYAVETAFIDENLFGSRCVFKPGNNNSVGRCFSQEAEPGNSVKAVFDGRIKTHLEWFESEELAEKYRDGKITFVHTYDTWYNKVLDTTFHRFRKREIVEVDPENGILPHTGCYRWIPLDKKPWWAG